MTTYDLLVEMSSGDLRTFRVTAHNATAAALILTSTGANYDEILDISRASDSENRHKVTR